MRVFGAQSFTKFGTELGTEFLIAKLNTIWFGKGTEALRFIERLRLVYVFEGITVLVSQRFTEIHRVFLMVACVTLIQY